jgi:hypothetical protein
LGQHTRLITMNNIAVLIIHGMGKFDADFYEPFAKRIRDQFSEEEKAHLFVDGCWWDDITQPMQKHVMQTLPTNIWWRGLHEFVIDRLGDPVSYLSSYFTNAPTVANSDSFYRRIHDRVLESLRRLEASAGSDAHLMVLAHSLGSVIVTNYRWDAEHGRAKTSEQPVTRMEKMQSLMSLMTYGSNIPLFIGVNPDSEPVTSITFPITGNDERLSHWDNLYSPCDVLGWPLANLWNANMPKIDEQCRMIGPWWKIWRRWTPITHVDYDIDRKFLRLIAERGRALLR